MWRERLWPPRGRGLRAWSTSTQLPEPQEALTMWGQVLIIPEQSTSWRSHHAGVRRNNLHLWLADTPKWKLSQTKGNKSCICPQANCTTSIKVSVFGHLKSKTIHFSLSVHFRQPKAKREEEKNHFWKENCPSHRWTEKFTSFSKQMHKCSGNFILLTNNTVMYVKPAAVVTSIGMDQSLQYPIRLYKNLKDKCEGQIKKRFNTIVTSLGLDKTWENGSFHSHCTDER